MRYKVPQNIDMQDRILGPLTMIQFLYAVVGGGFCYGIYMSSVPKPFSYMLIAPIAMLTLALVFLKVNERPFLDFLLSILEYSSSPRERIWHHQGNSNSNLNVEIYEAHPEDNKQTAHSKVFTHDDIANLARKLDNPQPK